MFTLFLVVIALVVGFGCGFLFYRNNVKTLKESEESLKNKFAAIEEELKKLKG